MEDVMNLRGGVLRGVVQSIDDSGQVQMATVQTHDGVIRQVEVWQPDGFAGMPSGDGAVALLFAVGNDPSQFVALLANPSTRFGKQANGERSMSMPDGTRVAVRQGGTVEVWGGNAVITHSPVAVINANAVTADAASTTATGNLAAGTGATGSFTTPTGQVVTVQDGIIINIY